MIVAYQGIDIFKLSSQGLLQKPIGANHIFNTNVKYQNWLWKPVDFKRFSVNRLHRTFNAENGSHRVAVTRYQLLMNLDLDFFARSC